MNDDSITLNLQDLKAVASDIIEIKKDQGDARAWLQWGYSQDFFIFNESSGGPFEAVVVAPGPGIGGVIGPDRDAQVLRSLTFITATILGNFYWQEYIDKIMIMDLKQVSQEDLVNHIKDSDIHIAVGNQHNSFVFDNNVNIKRCYSIKITEDDLNVCTVSILRTDKQYVVVAEIIEGV